MSFFKKHKLAFFLLAIVAFLFIFTDSDIPSTNSSSRYLTINSLVKNGSFIITENNVNTDDKIFREGNFYSSKPPFLSVVAAGIYYPLYHIFSWELPTKPFLSHGFSLPAVYVINLLLVGGSFILLLYYFYQILILIDIEKKYRYRLLAGLALATLYLPYSTVFNNHTIAGSFLFISFYYLCLLKIQGFKKKWIFWSGLLAALAAVIDLPTGLAFFSGFFIYYFFRYGAKNIFYYILPAIFLFSLHLYLNIQITGDILPPQLHSEMWSVNGQMWNLEAKGNIFKHSLLVYTFNIFFGTHGLFFYSPILLLSFFGLYKLLKNKNKDFFWEAILVALTFLAIYIFYAFGSRAYAGAAYGFRWFLAPTPILYFFITFLFREKPGHKLVNLFIYLFLISFLINIIGLFRVWAPYYIYDIGGIEYLWPFLTNAKKIVELYLPFLL
ncbi:hypothetical protein KKH39_00710 [Patescibacteria group bacterium]|nr:hypothetical protein [Patescibacteria group bacterium]